MKTTCEVLRTELRSRERDQHVRMRDSAVLDVSELHVPSRWNIHRYNWDRGLVQRRNHCIEWSTWRPMEAESENSVYDELEASRKLLSTMDTLLSGLRGRKLCQEGNLHIL